MSPEEIPAMRAMDAQGATKSIIESFPEFGRETLIKYVGGGMDNEVFRTKNGYLFRFSKEPDASKTSETEIRLLPVLQKSLTIPIPNIEFAALQPNGCYFFGYKGIEGTPLTQKLIATLDKQEFDHLIDRLAGFVNELRAFPTEEAIRAGVIEQKIGFVANIWKKFEHSEIAELDSDERATIAQAFEECLSDDKNSTYKPTLVHADLGPEHVLYDLNAKNVAGIIDWSDMVVTDPVYEMQDVYQNFGVKFTRALLEKMGTDVERELKLAKFFTIARNLNRYIRRSKRGDSRASINLRIVKEELQRI